MLSESVDYLPLNTLFTALEINRATGYRYLKRISETLNNSNVWMYESGDGSLNKEDIKIFELYIKLALEHNPKFAAKNLIQELKNHGYTIEKNQQNRQSNQQSNYQSTGNYEQSNQQSTATNEQSNSTKSSTFYDSLLGI